MANSQCVGHSLVAVTGDLKLEGPVSSQVKLLLEENAALQVTLMINPEASSFEVCTSKTTHGARLSLCCLLLLVTVKHCWLLGQSMCAASQCFWYMQVSMSLSAF